MAKGKLLVGLDIGSSSVKLCQLKEAKRGYQLRAFDMVQFPHEAIVDGVIMNQSSVVESIRSLVGRNRIRQKECAISVSGYSVIVKRIALPLMTDQELETNLQWEVEQHIPFDINDVYIDKQVLVRNPAMGTMDVLLVASKREIVNEYLAVTREAGLTPKVVDVDCFSVQNMTELNYPDMSETVAILDLGASITSIIIVADGVTAFTRDITMGGNQITEEIQKQLNITQEEAEAYKVGGREGDIDAVIPHEVEEVIQQVSETVAQEIQRSLSFFMETSSAGAISRVLLTGGTAKSPTLLRVIGETTGIPVEIASPFAALQYDPRTYNPDYLNEVAPLAGVAVGLAMRRTNER
ncbi:MAG: type IV pilus assembly protein PilM [Myxococcota bacterium]|jgi:type IV pilus assembly protein PilM|nr:type IV pilus assembly protein PilM [Myxococcota bacterium]